MTCGEGGGAYARTRPQTARSTADATLSTNQIAGDNRAFSSIYGFDTRPDQLDRSKSPSNWFLPGNWSCRVFPGGGPDANIDTVTPNATVIASRRRISPKSLRRSKRDRDAYNPERRDIDQIAGLLAIYRAGRAR